MFLGNAVYASDLQQQKIEQLEQLLQSYIEENSILKRENQALKGELQSQKNLANDQTLGAKETCDTSTSTCLDDELCKIATFKLLGKQNWKVGSYTIFVDEAKRRGLTCDVAEVDPAEKTEQEIAKQEGETAELQTTAIQRCEADLTGCNKEDLCDTATYGFIGMKKWMVGSYTIFVDEAKRRGLTCGVAETTVRPKSTSPKISDDHDKSIPSEGLRLSFTASCQRPWLLTNRNIFVDANSKKQFCPTCSVRVSGSLESEIISYNFENDKSIAIEAWFKQYSAQDNIWTRKSKIILKKTGQKIQDTTDYVFECN